MRYRLTLFLFFFFISRVSLSQLINIPTIGNEVMRETRYSDVEGSPYLFSDWKTGTIVDNTGREYVNRLIKYDAYKDQVEINQDGSVLLLNSGLYPKFLIFAPKEGSEIASARTFKSGYKVEGYRVNQYFEVLHEGSSAFLKKLKVNFIDETVNSYGTSKRIKRFIIDVKYFIINSGGVATEIKLKKNNLLESLGQDAAKAEKYINDNRIRVRSETDVIGVLTNL